MKIFWAIFKIFSQNKFSHLKIDLTILIHISSILEALKFLNLIRHLINASFQE